MVVFLIIKMETKRNRSHPNVNQKSKERKAVNRKLQFLDLISVLASSRKFENIRMLTPFM